MEGTLPKGFKSKNISKKPYKNHEERNSIIVSLSISIVIVLAFGWFSGIFAWMHDMSLVIDQQKAKIRSDVQAETSCSNLKYFVSQWDGYWDKPYSVEQAQKRMVELHC